MSTSPHPAPPRIALVTGAAVRIGRAIALDLARHGWQIGVHHHRSEAAAAEVVREVEAAGSRAVALKADLARLEDVKALLPELAARLGPATLLVNNASLFLYDDLAGMTGELWQSHIDVNLRAPLFLAQAFAAGLPAGADGNIINIVDQRVWRPTPQFLTYAISKAGLWDATPMLAQALAPRVRVNAIGPGPVLPSIYQTPEAFETQCRATLGRGTTPEEIAAAISYILDAPSMTGQMIALDGGQHLAWQDSVPEPVDATGVGNPVPARRLSQASCGLRRIRLDTLEVRTLIGIHPQEKLVPQRLLISLEMRVAESGPFTSDRFEEVVDYESVVVDVRRIAAEGGVNLLETLADRIAERCLRDARVRSVSVRLEKPDVFPDCRSIGIEIERRQADAAN